MLLLPILSFWKLSLRKNFDFRIENEISIGKYTKIQTNAYITAYTTIEDYVFIAPMVATTNDNYIGRTEKRFKEIKGPHIIRKVVQVLTD